MSLRFLIDESYQQKLQYEDEAFTVYGSVTNWNYFFDKLIVPVSEAGLQVKTYTRSASTRRRYKGDPSPINVSASAHEWVYDPGRKVGNAVPGYTIVLDDGIEKRQFQFNGDVAELLLFAADHVNAPTRIYTQGARYEVEKSEVEVPDPN
jgi:hypothetical protein